MILDEEKQIEKRVCRCIELSKSIINAPTIEVNRLDTCRACVRASAILNRESCAFVPQANEIVPRCVRVTVRFVTLNKPRVKRI